MDLGLLRPHVRAIASCQIDRRKGLCQMKARITITLKNGVLDPQGKAVQNALGSLGITGVDSVRQGKFIEVELQAASEAAARETVERMCRELLANTVIENYAYEIVA